MVEHRRFGNLLPHLILLIGVAIVAFPVYLAIIASTHDNTVIANGQMPLYPGSHGARDLLEHDRLRHRQDHARSRSAA